MNKYRNILYFLIIGLIISLSVFVFSSIYSQSIPKIIEEINNSMIGAIITAIITLLLLSQQSYSDEIKERNQKVFENRITLYRDITAGIREILDDSTISEKEIHKLEFYLHDLTLISGVEVINDYLSILSDILSLSERNKDNEIVFDRYSDGGGFELNRKLLKLVYGFRKDLKLYTNSDEEFFVNVFDNYLKLDHTVFLNEINNHRNKHFRPEEGLWDDFENATDEIIIELLKQLYSDDLERALIVMSSGARVKIFSNMSERASFLVYRNIKIRVNTDTKEEFEQSVLEVRKEFDILSKQS